MTNEGFTLTTIEDINNVFSGKVIDRIEEDPDSDGFIIVCGDGDNTLTMKIFRRRLFAYR